MMRTMAMSEHRVRLAAYKLPLKPNTKLTLLGIIQRVDWATMSGSVSARSVADVMGLNERTVRRAMMELEQLGHISRDRMVASNGRNAASMTRVLLSCQSDRGDSVNMTGGGGQYDTLVSCQSDRTLNNPIDQPTNQPIDQSIWNRPSLPSSTPVTQRRGYR